MCGDYYIGGRRFSSLSDLIGYYSYVSCLLKEEKLLSPVAPPEVRPKYFQGRFEHIAAFSCDFTLFKTLSNMLCDGVLLDVCYFPRVVAF